MSIYITGDTHGNFDRIAEFCYDTHTTTDDLMIILGDAGINYYLDRRDLYLKSHLAQLPITFFCIHGNHEARPDNVPGYELISFRGNPAYWEPECPNVCFAMDGMTYDFDGKQTFVCGGAYSVDKHYRLARGWNWFEDEQPSEARKGFCSRALAQRDWKVDRVLTHTCPFKYIPREMFLPQIDQSTVDNSTVLWLDGIEDALDYGKWYCGHYHTDKSIDKIRFLFKEIIPWE